MARLFTDGAEMGDVEFWDDKSNMIVGTAAPAPFGGTYWYLLNPGTGNVTWKTFVAMAEGYFRNRVLVANLSTTQKFANFRTGSTNVAWIGLDGAGRFQVEATTLGILAVSTLVMNPNQWYLLDCYYKEADAPNGRFVVYADGNKIIDFTGDTKPGAGTTFDNVAIASGPLAGMGLYMDDLALNDTTGGVDNSYCLDGIVVKVTPDGNGTHNNWHGSDGDDVNNYLLCDEFPKDDDVTYNYRAGADAGTQQQFAMSHLSFTGYTILRLWAEVRARKTAAAAMTLKLGQLAAGGADVVSAGRALYVNNYGKVVGDDSFVNPVDGNPWEEADIDAIEFVAQVT
jgi:hypothetical protein